MYRIIYRPSSFYEYQVQKKVFLIFFGGLFASLSIVIGLNKFSTT